MLLRVEAKLLLASGAGAVLTSALELKVLLSVSLSEDLRWLDSTNYLDVKI
jgi:hypothetical protein